MRLLDWFRRKKAHVEKAVMDIKGIPEAKIYEWGGAGLQATCPFCPYGVGDAEIFIEGFSKVVVKTCSKCGNKYQTITIESIPRSGRAGL